MTAVPDIYEMDLGTDVEFILLASDGLWDYMKRSAEMCLFIMTVSSYPY